MHSVTDGQMVGNTTVSMLIADHTCAVVQSAKNQCITRWSRKQAYVGECVDCVLHQQLGMAQHSDYSTAAGQASSN